MKKNLLLLTVSCLIIGTIVSCKKDDDKDDEQTTTTGTTTSGPVTTNPLTTKTSYGTATVTVNDTVEPMNSIDTMFVPLKFFAVYNSGTTTDNSLEITTGDKKRPSSAKLYSVLGDVSKMPDGDQVIVTYYDDATHRELYATDGVVSYAISATEKTVKFDHLNFRSEDHTVNKTISYEVKLK